MFCSVLCIDREILFVSLKITEVCVCAWVCVKLRSLSPAAAEEGVARQPGSERSLAPGSPRGREGRRCTARDHPPSHCEASPEWYCTVIDEAYTRTSVYIKHLLTTLSVVHSR